MWIKLQSRQQQAVQTHNAVVQAAGTSSKGNDVWIDTDGYDNLGVTIQSSASLSKRGILFWSNDGATQHGREEPLTAGTDQLRTTSVPTKARYVKLEIVNADGANPQTFNAWVYLKS